MRSTNKAMDRFILFGVLNREVFGGRNGDNTTIGAATRGDGQVSDARLRRGSQGLLLVLQYPIVLFDRIAAPQEIPGFMIAGPLGTGRIGSRAGSQKEGEHSEKERIFKHGIKEWWAGERT